MHIPTSAGRRHVKEERTNTKGYECDWLVFVDAMMETERNGTSSRSCGAWASGSRSAAWSEPYLDRKRPGDLGYLEH